MRQVRMSSAQRSRKDYIWRTDLQVYLDIVTRFRRDFGREKRGILHDIFSSLLLLNPRYSRRLRFYFLGDEALAWLLRKTIAKSFSEAIQLGEQLRKDGVFSHICCERPFESKKLMYKFEFRNDKETTVHILQHRNIWDDAEDPTSAEITYEMIASSLQAKGFDGAARAFQLIGLMEEKNKAENESLSHVTDEEVSSWKDVDHIPKHIECMRERVHCPRKEDVRIDPAPAVQSPEDLFEAKRIISEKAIESVSTIGESYPSGSTGLYHHTHSIASLNDEAWSHNNKSAANQVVRSVRSHYYEEPNDTDDRAEMQIRAPRLRTMQDINRFREKLRIAFQKDDETPLYIDNDGDTNDEMEVVTNIETLLLAKEFNGVHSVTESEISLSRETRRTVDAFSGGESYCTVDPIDEINEAKERRSNPASSRRAPAGPQPPRKRRSKEAQIARIRSGASVYSPPSSRGRRSSSKNTAACCNSESSFFSHNVHRVPGAQRYCSPSEDASEYDSLAAKRPGKSASSSLRTSRALRSSRPTKRQSLPAKRSSLFGRISGNLLHRGKFDSGTKQATLLNSVKRSVSDRIIHSRR